MTEVVLTRRIIDAIKKYPGTYVQRVSDRFLSGIPDIRVVCFGLSADIEVKLPGKGGESEPTPIQKKVLERIAAAGGSVAVVKSVDEAVIFMNRLYKKGREHHESSVCKNT